MRVATSIGLVLLASGAASGTGPAAEDTRAPGAQHDRNAVVRFEGVDEMRVGAGRGCAFIVVLDSVSGTQISGASVALLPEGQGGISDSLGRCVLCGLEDDARRPLKVLARGYVARWDTATIVRGRPDTLVMWLARSNVRGR